MRWDNDFLRFSSTPLQKVPNNLAENLLSSYDSYPSLKKMPIYGAFDEPSSEEFKKIKYCFYIVGNSLEAFILNLNQTRNAKQKKPI